MGHQFLRVETLDSWKEIATFLRRGVRTVQRWERTEGLPVRRHHHLKRGSVRAAPAELQEWMRIREGGLRVTAGTTKRASRDMQHLDRFRTLMSRHTVLARELTELLRINANVRTRISQSRSTYASSVAQLLETNTGSRDSGLRVAGNR